MPPHRPSMRGLLFVVSSSVYSRCFLPLRFEVFFLDLDFLEALRFGGKSSSSSSSSLSSPSSSSLSKSSSSMSNS